MYRIIALLFVLLCGLTHCIPKALDVECAKCPCPDGYACTPAGYCLRTENVGKGQTQCGLPESKEATRDAAEPSPDRKPPLDVASEPPADRSQATEKGPEINPDVKPQPQPTELGYKLLPPTILPLGASCPTIRNILANEVCDVGLKCTQLTGDSAFCLQDCSSDPTICSKNTDGRTFCRQFGWTKDNRPESRCIRLSKENETCNIAQSTGCDRQGTFLVCESGKCIKGTLLTNPGAACNTGGNTPLICSINAKLTCSPKGMCVKGVRAFLGTECDDSTRICGPGQACQTSMARVGGESTSKRCYYKCSKTSDCTKTNNPHCEEGICLRSGCESASQCPLLAGFSCVFTNKKGISIKSACLPTQQKGVGVGELCSKGCGLGLRCLTIQKGYPEQCTTLCRSSADCQKIGAAIGRNTSKGRCVGTSGGVKYCAWTCETASDCPYDKASCVIVPNLGKYCVPPL